MEQFRSVLFPVLCAQTQAAFESVENISVHTEVGTTGSVLLINIRINCAIIRIITPRPDVRISVSYPCRTARYDMR